MAADKAKIYGYAFEVFGKVQGVFFRKHTSAKAKQLGLHGWCMNTNEGTVKGELQGNYKALNDMKAWLSTQGSPKSRIDKSVFTDIKEVSDYTYKDFVVRR